MRTKPDDRGQDLSISAVAIVVITIILVACRPSSASHPSATAASPTAAHAAVAHQPGNPQDNRAAGAIVTQTSDLSGNWTSLEKGTVATADLAQPSTCLTPPAKFAGAVASAYDEFSLDLDTKGLESGHLVSHAIFDNTAQDAAADMAVIDSGAYGPCRRQSVSDKLPTSVHLVQALAEERSTRSLPLDGDAFGLTATYTAGTNRPDTLTLSDIHLVSGRIMVHLQFYLCSCKPHDLAAWSRLQGQVIQAAATRIMQARKAEG